MLNILYIYTYIVLELDLDHVPYHCTRYFSSCVKVLPNEKIARISGTKPAVIQAALDVSGIICDAYNNNNIETERKLSPTTCRYRKQRPLQSSPPLHLTSPPLALPSQQMSARILLPHLFGASLLNQAFLSQVHSFTGAGLYLQRPAYHVVALCAVGTPRTVRETICTVFKAVVDVFFRGNIEAIRLSVQFKVAEVGGDAFSHFFFLPVRFNILAFFR